MRACAAVKVYDVSSQEISCATCLLRGWRRHRILCRRPLRRQNRPRIGRGNRNIAAFLGRIHKRQCVGHPRELMPRPSFQNG